LDIITFVVDGCERVLTAFICAVGFCMFLCVFFRSLCVWLSAVSVVQLLDNKRTCGTRCLLNYNNATVSEIVYDCWRHLFGVMVIC